MIRFIRSRIDLYIVIAILIILPILVFADEGHGHHHDSGGVIGDLTGGDQLVNIGGNSSDALGLGFSYTLGDVDLNEGRNCYVSIAKGNILWGRQKVKLNPWCAALFYDANREHKFAAEMRCSIDPIVEKYVTYKDCVKGQTMSPGEITRTPDVDEVLAKFQEFENEREVIVEEIRQQLEEQNQQYEELAAQQSQPRIIKQAAPEPYISQELANELRFDKE